MRIESTAVPQFSFLPGSVKVHTEVKVSFNILGGANVAVFTSPFDSDVAITMKGWSPIPSFTNVKTSWKAVSSAFAVDMAKLQPGITLAMQTAIKQLDWEFVGGFILPFPTGYLLTDTTVAVRKDVISIDSNIKPGHP